MFAFLLTLFCLVRLNQVYRNKNIQVNILQVNIQVTGVTCCHCRKYFFYFSKSLIEQFQTIPLQEEVVHLKSYIKVQDAEWLNVLLFLFINISDYWSWLSDVFLFPVLCPQVFAVRSGGATGVVVKGPEDKSSVAFRYLGLCRNIWRASVCDWLHLRTSYKQTFDISSLNVLLHLH